MTELKWTRCFSLVGVMAVGCTDDATNTDEVGDTGTETAATDSTSNGETSSSDTTTTDTTDTTATDTTDTTATDTTDTTTDTTDTTGGETCSDSVMNQDETDVDCGGLICGPCADGQMCAAPEDCASTNCDAGICAPLGCQSDADCMDLADQCNSGTCDLMTGECAAAPANEGLDCDSGDLCMPGGLCTAGACMGTPTDCTGLDDVCNVGTCDPMDGSCAAVPANEGVDCGDLCVPGSMCMGGSCMGGAPVDCSGLDDACNLGTCDPGDGSCVAAPANEGVACNDGEACTLTDVCTDGVCTDPNNPNGFLFSETFINNNAGWTLGTNWSIGPAVAGCGDPGTDHTPTNDNGIAGVVRGGCAPAGNNIATFFCLTSPVMDTSGLPTVFVNYWRDLYSDYTPYQKNKIEVWNGATWNIVFETFGAPETNDAAWTNFNYNITAYKNPTMQIRWCYSAAAGAFQRGSWNVDDITVGQVSCTATP